MTSREFKRVSEEAHFASKQCRLSKNKNMGFRMPFLDMHHLILCIQSYLSSRYHDSDLDHILEVFDNFEELDLGDQSHYRSWCGISYDSDHLDSFKASTEASFKFFGMEKNKDFLTRVYLMTWHTHRRRAPILSKSLKCKRKTVRRMMEEVKR